MRRITFCLMIMMMFALTAVSAQAAGGHDDHGHGAELSKSQIEQKASGLVAKIVEKGQLDPSWKQIKPQKASETRNHTWLVTFVNPEIKESDKKTLYMFLTLSGEYLAANFTGK